MRKFLKSLIRKVNNNNNHSTNNLEKISPNITKVDYNINNNSEPNFLLRTIIDNHMNHEDIFSKILKKSFPKLPEQSEQDRGKITLFVPMDEVLFYTYIPDENLSMFQMPKFKEYDMRIDLVDYKTFAFIYYRDYLEEFLNYIDNKFEPILYSTGDKLYVDKIMNEIDPNKIFRHRLYQEDCHLFKDNSQDMAEYLKDINLFTNRSLKRKVLIDFSPLNYTISPDNIIPVEQYHPDQFSNPNEKDESLKEVMDTLEVISEYEDVREFLKNSYNLRQIAINSKLL